MPQSREEKNPVKFLDPDGKQQIGSFDFLAYTQNVFAGTYMAIKASIQDQVGQSLNYWQNVFKGNCEAKVSLSISFGNGLIEGELSRVIGQKIEVGFTGAVDPKTASEIIQSLSGSPITISGDSISLSASVVDISFSKDNKSMTIGLSKDVDIFEDLLSVSGGLEITASTQNGSFSTLESGGNKQMQKDAKEGQYYMSSQYFIDSLGGL